MSLLISTTHQSPPSWSSLCHPFSSLALPSRLSPAATREAQTDILHSIWTSTHSCLTWLLDACRENLLMRPGGTVPVLVRGPSATAGSLSGVAVLPDDGVGWGRSVAPPGDLWPSRFGVRRCDVGDFLLSGDGDDQRGDGLRQKHKWMNWLVKH